MSAVSSATSRSVTLGSTMESALGETSRIGASCVVSACSAGTTKKSALARSAAVAREHRRGRCGGLHGDLGRGVGPSVEL